MSDVKTTLNSFLEDISATPHAALVFVDSGQVIYPDYHVTELKSVAVDAIDCGRNKTTWQETIVQLLDGPARETGSHMSVSKFVSIAAFVAKELPALGGGKLYFEFGPDNNVLHKYSPMVTQQDNEQVLVALHSDRAVCKPARNWTIERPESSTGSCCGDGKADTSCCAA